ncbi:hypothetical protein G7Y29_03175 [Corynebacterium qintianiae]|uniref:Uncharacterized protein n=1 Tax=Corynebacterium qintianiae TaxID=2709392 RepID=A0A7T0KNJ9_9CORY|nr:hypothetical protein [Corynebacterium qintianiae]QPK83812.1 hypothetical protein G7Y29_03175 [Corynebacterium qintianiae]
MQGNNYDWGQQRPPTEQFPPQGYPYAAPQPAPQPANGNRGLIVALVVGVVALLLALVGMIAYMSGAGNGFGFTSGNNGNTPVTVMETQTMTRQQPTEQTGSEGEVKTVTEHAPAPASNRGCGYSNYAAGTSATSGEFAANVYSAFRDACANAGGPNVSVRVYSPVTGKNYNMSCSGSGTVYCRGGNNAVVRIW